jgi:hypothetical protein
MKERFHIIIETPSEDITVKKMLLSLLSTWSSKYQGEQGMQILQRLYERGMSTFQQQNLNSSNSNAMNNPMFDRLNGLPVTQEKKKAPPPPAIRNPPPTQHFNNQYAYNIPPPNDIGSTSRNNNNNSGLFNFEKMKPKIIQEVALAKQSANNLVNALRLINTEKDDWEYYIRKNRTIQQSHQKCEEEKKKIVRYARLVEDEEWIGTLLMANEELLRALNMYDVMLTGQLPSELISNQQQQQDILQITQYDDSHLPRDENGEILQDPFADP